MEQLLYYACALNSYTTTLSILHPPRIAGGYKSSQNNEAIHSLPTFHESVQYILYDPDKKFLQATPMAKMLEMFHEESLHVQSPLCFVTKFSHTPDLGRLLQISFEHLNIFYQFFWNKI